MKLNFAFPSPLGDSILITLSENPDTAKYPGFRPLSGIQFSLPSFESAGKSDSVKFPSPLGDSILITKLTSLCKAEAAFPSPLGDSILIT